MSCVRGNRKVAPAVGPKLNLHTLYIMYTNLTISYSCCDAVILWGDVAKKTKKTPGAWFHHEFTPRP